MKLNYLFLAMFILLIGFSTALEGEYPPQKQNTDSTLVVHIDNSTACNLTYITYPDNTGKTFNLPLTKTGVRDWNIRIEASNFTQLGLTCATVTCISDIGLTAGDEFCGEVTPQGDRNVLGLTFILFFLVYGIGLWGFFGKNEIVTIVGGMGMIVLSIYSINYGIDVYRNFMTIAVSYFTLVLGAFFAISAGISLIQDNLN